MRTDTTGLEMINPNTITPNAVSAPLKRRAPLASINLARALRRWVCFTALALAFTGALSPSSARAEVKDGVMQRLLESDAVRHRKLMRHDRLELGLTLGSSAGELYTRSFLVGLQAQTYLSDSFGLGGFVFYALNFDSALAERVRTLRPNRVNDETFAQVNFGASLETMLVPAFGKASLLGAMTARYDLNIILGVGALQQSGAGELEQFAVAPVVGLGTRLFLSDTLAVNIGLRDYAYKRAQNAILLQGDEGPAYVASPRWQHQFFLTATFSFFTGKPQTSL